VPSDLKAAPVHGRLAIRAERIGGKTVVTAVHRTEPFHLGAPVDRVGDGRAEIIIQSVGPGLLPGDETATELAAGPGAFLIVRDQAALKLFSSRDGGAAVSHVQLRAEAGATLIFLPGELIPYRDARFKQTTEIEVEPGGRIAFAEIITPGRTGMGETDRYARLDLRVRARIGGDLVLLDRAVLEPALRPLTAIGRHGAHPVSAALYLIGADWPDIPPIEYADGTLFAAGAGAGCRVVRALGPTAQSIHRLLAYLLESIT